MCYRIQGETSAGGEGIHGRCPPGLGDERGEVFDLTVYRVWRGVPTVSATPAVVLEHDETLRQRLGGRVKARSQSCPPTTMIGWLSPNRSKAIWELSCEVTEFNSPSLHDVELEVGHINALDDPRALELDGSRAQTVEKSNALTEQDGRDKVA